MREIGRKHLHNLKNHHPFISNNRERFSASQLEPLATAILRKKNGKYRTIAAPFVGLAAGTIELFTGPYAISNYIDSRIVNTPIAALPDIAAGLACVGGAFAVGMLVNGAYSWLRNGSIAKKEARRINQSAAPQHVPSIVRRFNTQNGYSLLDNAVTYGLPVLGFAIGSFAPGVGNAVGGLLGGVGSVIWTVAADSAQLVGNHNMYKEARGIRKDARNERKAYSPRR